MWKQTRLISSGFGVLIPGFMPIIGRQTWPKGLDVAL